MGQTQMAKDLIITIPATAVDTVVATMRPTSWDDTYAFDRVHVENLGGGRLRIYDGNRAERAIAAEQIARAATTAAQPAAPAATTSRPTSQSASRARIMVPADATAPASRECNGVTLHLDGYGREFRLRDDNAPSVWGFSPATVYVRYAYYR